MDLRTELCFALSRWLTQPPAERTVDYTRYDEWRHASLARSWSAFSDAHITGRDVVDFGCGDGQLALFLAREKRPRRIVGVDLNPAAVERARAALAASPVGGADVDFVVGYERSLPFAAESFDTLLAFDCLEHVMEPATILAEWHRVLRAGGRCLIEWFPFKGPWGPHMEALVPIPWAHVVFGERAMFRSAERIYDLPEFVPRHWDLDEQGRKKPNKWRQWSSFEEQGFINKLDLPTFRRIARDAGFALVREERHSFGGSTLRRRIGRTLMEIPVAGEYFVSFVDIELARPE